jgi:hypothetical protein
MLYISEDILAQLLYALVLASKSSGGSVAFACNWAFHTCERGGEGRREGVGVEGIG